MSALTLFGGGEVDDLSTQKFVQIIPCSGWWALSRFTDPKRDRIIRHRVAAWGHYVDENGVSHIVALIPGDIDGLIPARSYEVGEPYGLWADGQSYCTCRSYEHDSELVDDVRWCESCAGEIR